MKNVLGILAGLISAFVVIFLVEKAGHSIFPVAENIDFGDKEALKKIIDTMPFGALITVIIAYAIGSFAGGFVCALISENSKVRNSVITGFILLIFGLINLFMIPHPVWFMILNVLVYLPFAYLGGKYGEKIRPEKKPEPAEV